MLGFSLSASLMKKVFLVFLLWISIINSFALLAQNRFNLIQDSAYPWIPSVTSYEQKRWDILSLHAYWDSYWYLDIAQSGYSYKPGSISNIVFFPLYPLLIRLFSYLLMGNIILAGWILSSFFLLLSLVYLYKLVYKFHPDIYPYSPLFFLLIFPTSFFLNSVYTESLFLFLTTASFYYAFSRKWWLVGIFGILASLTRPTGLIVFLPLLWEYLSAANFKLSSLFSIKSLPLYLIPQGFFLFSFYHYLAFNDFWLFFTNEKIWGRSITIKLGYFELNNAAAVTNFTLDIFFVIFALIILYYIFKRLRSSYAIYLTVSLFFILSSGTPSSIGRYVLILFPIYIFAASIKNVYIHYTWIISSVLLMGMYITLFVNRYWAG